MKHETESFRGSRRWLPTAIAAIVALGPAVGAEQVFDFDVNLDRRPIGTIRFTGSRQDDGTRISRSSAAFDGRVL